MTKRITLPITEKAIADLHAGDSVLLTGTCQEMPTLRQDAALESPHRK